MLKDAIKFENWNFLEEHLSGNPGEKRQWLEAKAKVARDRASRRGTGDLESKVYKLSRQFPMFQEDSIPSVKMDVVNSNWYDPIFLLKQNPKEIMCTSRQHF